MLRRFDRSDLPDRRSAQRTLERYVDTLRANPELGYEEYMAIRGKGPENVTVAMGSLIASRGWRGRGWERSHIKIVRHRRQPRTLFEATVRRATHDNSLSVHLFSQKSDFPNYPHMDNYASRDTSLYENTETGLLGQTVTGKGEVTDYLSADGIDRSENFTLSRCKPDAVFLSPDRLLAQLTDPEPLPLSARELNWLATTENDSQTAAYHLQGYARASMFLVGRLLEVAG